MGYALVDFKLVGEGGLDPESFVGALGWDLFDRSQGLDDACKHGVKFGFLHFILESYAKDRYLCPSKKLLKEV
jgi:hypothetical protein